MHETVIKMLDEVTQLLMATDDLNAFADWPDDLIASNSAPKPLLTQTKLWHSTHPRTTGPHLWFMRLNMQQFIQIDNSSVPKKKLIGIFLIIVPVLN